MPPKATGPLSGAVLWVHCASAGIRLARAPLPRERGVGGPRRLTPPSPCLLRLGPTAVSFSCPKFAALLARFRTLDASSLKPSDDGFAPLPPQSRRLHQISGSSVPLVLARTPIGKLNAPCFRTSVAARLPLRAHDLLLRYIRSFDTKRSLYSAIGRVKLTCLSTI